jgi:hypothetical protein
MVPPEGVVLPPLPPPPLPVAPPVLAPPELVCGADELEQDRPAAVILTATMTTKANGTRGGMHLVYTACAAIPGHESTGPALTPEGAIDATWFRKSQALLTIDEPKEPRGLVYEYEEPSWPREDLQKCTRSYFSL